MALDLWGRPAGAERSGCDADQREEAANITKTADANPLYFNIYSKRSSTFLSSSSSSLATLYDSSQARLGPSRESDLTGKVFVVQGEDIEDMVNEDLKDISKEEDTVEEYLTLRDAVIEPIEDTATQDPEDADTEPLQYFITSVSQDSIKEALQADQSLQDNDQPLESLVEGVDASMGKVLDDWVTSVCAQTLVEPEPNSEELEALQDLPRRAGSKSNGISSFAARNRTDESFAKHSGESLKVSAGHWSDAIISGRKGGPRRFVFDTGRVFT